MKCLENSLSKMYLFKYVAYAARRPQSEQEECWYGVASLETF